MSNKQLQKLLEQVEAKKSQLDTFRPLSSELIKELNEWYKIELISTLLLIESNNLATEDIVTLIQKNLSIEGKTLSDHLEIVGYADAIEYIFDLARCGMCDLTLENIIQIYKLAYGRTHQEDNRLLQSPEKIEQFLSTCVLSKIDPILNAINSLIKIAQSKYFAKGNTVVGWLVMNLLLLQKGYVPVVIGREDQEHAIKLLANLSINKDQFLEFIVTQLLESLDFYLIKVSPPL